jgi:DnaJ-class molecular chaperone
MTDDERCQKYFNKRFPLTGPLMLGPCEACGGSGTMVYTSRMGQTVIAQWEDKCSHCVNGRVLIAREA